MTGCHGSLCLHNISDSNLYLKIITKLNPIKSLKIMSMLFFIYFLKLIFFFFVFLPFLGPLPRHMEVPRLGVLSEL